MAKLADDSSFAARARAAGKDAAAEADFEALRAAETAVTLGMLGPYELLEEVGRGGQGVVYRARQPHTQRQIALKRLAAGAWATADMRRWFQREVQALARLKHPGIVTAYGLEIVAGQPLLLMEWINGRPVTQWARPAHGARRPAREILAMMARVCEAIEHAHQQGVIHRDLKSSNILVDAADQPHVLDFGLAKLLDAAEEGAAADATTTGFVGTPVYAAPEQLLHGAHGAEVRADIYALGVIAYEMLTGQKPYPAARTQAEMLEAIRTTDPARPSSLQPALDRDTDVVILKAMAREKNDRYPSVTLFRRDLEHLVRGEPIAARRDDAWYLLRKRLRRSRVALLLTTLALFVTAGFSVALTDLVQRTRRAERQTAQAAAQRAALLSDSNIDRARLLAAAGNVPTAERLLWHEFFATEGRGARGDAADHAYWGLREVYAAQPCVRTLALAESQNYSLLRFDPAGEQLTAILSAGQVALWNLSTETVHLPGRIAESGPGTFFTTDASGRVGAAQSAETLTLWDVARAQPLRAPWRDAFAPHSAAVSPDGGLVAVGLTRGVVRFFDTRAGAWRAETRLPAGVPRQCVFSGDGATLLCLCNDGAIYTVDPAAGRIAQRGTVRVDQDSFLECSPNGTIVAVPAEGRIQLLGAPHAPAQWELPGHSGRVNTLAFSPDGRRLASAGTDKTIRLWDLADGRVLATWTGHRGNVSAIRFTPNGEQVVTGGFEGTVKFWEAVETEAVTRVPFGHSVRAVCFAGDRLVCADETGRVRFLDALGKHAFAEAREHSAAASSLVCAPHAALLASGGYDGTIQFWNVADGQPLGSLRPGATDRIHEIAFSPDGHRLAAADAAGAVSVWEQVAAPADSAAPAAFALRRVLKGSATRMPAVAFSPDNRWLAAVDAAGNLFLWPADWAASRPANANPPDGAVRRIEAHTPIARTLAFHPSGRLLATGGDDAVIRFWEPETGQLLRELQGHRQDVFSLHFSPDGTLLASSDRAGAVTLWETATGRELTKLAGHTDMAFMVRFSPDGRRLASCGRDGTVLIHDLHYFTRHIDGNRAAWRNPP